MATTAGSDPIQKQAFATCDEKRSSQHRSSSTFPVHHPRLLLSCSPRSCAIPPAPFRSPIRHSFRPSSHPSSLRPASPFSPPLSQSRSSTHRPPVPPFTLLCVAILLLSLASPVTPLAPNPWPRKCDYSAGFWQRAPKRMGVPRYTARAGEKGHCPYVRPLFACERNNRPDSRYQRYTWHPKGCRLTRFSGSGFEFLMRRRRMLLVGDSIMANLFEALLCAIHAAGYTGKPYVRRTRGSFNIKAVRFPRFSFSLEFLFSPYLVHASQQASSSSTHGGNHGFIVNVDKIDPTLASILPGYDAAVFSTGVWWSQNVPGRRQGNTFRAGGLDRNLTNLAAHSWGLATLNRHLRRSNFPGVPFFLSFSPKHAGHGMPQPWVAEAYRGGRSWGFHQSGKIPSNFSGPHVTGSCGALTPMKRTGLLERYSFGSAERFYAVQRATLKGSILRLLKITRLSKSRPDGHLGVWYKPRAAKGSSSPVARGMNPFDGDCTHWCLPGVPDTWVDILYNQLLLEPLLFSQKDSL